MKALSRIGSGKNTGWLNGWWVVVMALALGLGAPVILAIRSARRSGDRPILSLGFFGGDSSKAVAGEGVDARLASDSELGERMQMTIALAMAASLRLRKAQVERGLPVDTGALYEGMARERVEGRPVIPQNFSGPQDGSTREAVILRSVEGLYLLRYSPLRGGLVEVVSVSRRTDGVQPAMMARLPDDRMIFGDAVGFYTKYETAVDVASGRHGLDGLLEPAFAESARMVGAGWRIVKLKLPGAQQGEGQN